MLDWPELADGAVGGAEDGAGGFIQRPCAVFQCTGEERIEVFVGGEVFHQRLGHVHLVALGEPGREGVLEPAYAAFGDATGQPRQQVVRQQVLGKDEQAVFH
jgi:hypothetical protein